MGRGTLNIIIEHQCKFFTHSRRGAIEKAGAPQHAEKREQQIALQIFYEETGGLLYRSGIAD